MEKALVQFARAQGRLHALFKGAGWQRMLKEILKITEHKKTRQEIKHALAQVEKLSLLCVDVEVTADDL